ISVPAQDLQQTCTRVQAIVKTWPTVVEKQMTAHLASKWRVRFLQLGLDQRVPRFPHSRPSAVLANPRRKQTRALDVEDDLAARMVRQHVLHEQHDLSIRVNNLAILGHHTETVAVAVEREADFGIR